MEAYASGDFTPPAPPPRELPEFGWLRFHYRQVAMGTEFSTLTVGRQWERLTDQVLQSPAAMSARVLDEVPVPRRLEVLRWLGQTSDLPTAATLTLRAIAHIGEGPGLRTNRRAFQYEVLGLPSGQQAWIADFDGGWRVLRVIEGNQGQWTEPYISKEEALNALAETIDSSSASSEKEAV
jgi:hypothetical protein